MNVFCSLPPISFLQHDDPSRLSTENNIEKTSRAANTYKNIADGKDVKFKKSLQQCIMDNKTCVPKRCHSC